MEEHPILYEYYSKYSGGISTGVGGNISRLSSSIPKLASTFANTSKSTFLNTTKIVSKKMKEFGKDVGDIVIEWLKDNARDKLGEELLQGNNPYDSFMKNIDDRIKNSDEYLYNKQYTPTKNSPYISKDIKYNNLLMNNINDRIKNTKDYLHS